MDEERETIERRIAEAKRSMSTRLAALGERIDETRHLLSVREKVERHPVLVLGAAVAAGFLAGWRRGAPRAPSRQALVRATTHRGLVSTAVHEIIRSLIASVAAGAATRFVNQLGRDQPGRGEHDVGRPDDPDRRTTGVRIYPLT